MIETRLQLFRPSPCAAAVLLAVAALAVGGGIYLRYFAVENSTVGLACQAGQDGALCAARRTAIALYTRSIFGAGALIVAALNLLRPSPLLFGIGLVFAGFGVVLYNVNLSAFAVALLLLSLARRAPEPE